MIFPSCKGAFLFGVTSYVFLKYIYSSQLIRPSADFLFVGVEGGCVSNKLLKARLTVMFKVILLARVHPFFFLGGGRVKVR